MIKFSTRAHYGLRVVVDLARSYGGEPVSLMAIAKAENLSLGYLEQLVSHLRRAGLVEGSRGARGGYRLKRSPSEITVGKVLRALEGPVAPITCASERTEKNPCEWEDACPSREVWQRVRGSLVEVLDSMTLADLIRPRTREAVSCQYSAFSSNGGEPG